MEFLAAENIALQTNDNSVREQAIRNGLGVGVMFTHYAANHPDLIEVYPAKTDWYSSNWLLTHGDLHHSENVQRFLRLLAETME